MVIRVTQAPLLHERCHRLAAQPCLAAAAAGAQYHRNQVAAAYLDGR
jgi:hypothetical protein